MIIVGSQGGEVGSVLGGSRSIEVNLNFKHFIMMLMLIVRVMVMVIVRRLEEW